MQCVTIYTAVSIYIKLFCSNSSENGRFHAGWWSPYLTVSSGRRATPGGFHFWSAVGDAATAASPTALQNYMLLPLTSPPERVPRAGWPQALSSQARREPEEVRFAWVKTRLRMRLCVRPCW